MNLELLPDPRAMTMMLHERRLGVAGLLIFGFAVVSALSVQESNSDATQHANPKFSRLEIGEGSGKFVQPNPAVLLERSVSHSQIAATCNIACFGADIGATSLVAVSNPSTNKHHLELAMADSAIGCVYESGRIYFARSLDSGKTWVDSIMVSDNVSSGDGGLVALGGVAQLGELCGRDL